MSKGIEKKSIATKLLGAMGFAGILTTSGGGPAMVAITVDRIARTINGRLDESKQEKRERNIKFQLEAIQDRIDCIENLVEEEVDIFECSLRNAIEEDDQRKQPFYSVCLVWYLNDRPPAGLYRRVCSGVVALTSEELDAFLEWAEGRGSMKQIPDWSSQMDMFERFQAAGFLGPGTVRHVNNLTKVGLVFRDLCRAEPEIYRKDAS